MDNNKTSFNVSLQFIFLWNDILIKIQTRCEKEDLSILKFNARCYSSRVIAFVHDQRRRIERRAHLLKESNYFLFALLVGMGSVDDFGTLFLSFVLVSNFKVNKDTLVSIIVFYITNEQNTHSYITYTPVQQASHK